MSTIISKTYNTGIKAKKGDLVKVSFTDVSKYIDPDTREISFGLWAPHVIEKLQDGKTTSIKELEKIVNLTTGRIQERKARVFEYTPEGVEPKSKNSINKRPDARTEIPEGYPKNPADYADDVNLYYPLSTAYFAEKAWEYWSNLDNKAKYTKEAQDEITTRIKQALEKFKISNSKIANYVFQIQFPQAFGHGDFRYEDGEGALNGFTFAISIEGKKEIKSLFNHDTSKRIMYWNDKVYYSYDKDKKILEDNTKKLENEILNYYKKFAFDNSLWKIDLKTGKEKKRIEDKVEVERIWTTKKSKEPKEWLHINNTVVPPKIINPDLPGGTEFLPGIFIIIDKGKLAVGAIKPNFVELFLDGGWKGRAVFVKLRLTERFDWLYWKAESQIPYVLEKRARDKKWLPDGYSALPPQLEHLVPIKLVYWDTKIPEAERLKRRSLLIDFFSNREMLNSDGRFILSKRSYRGQFVIRGLFVVDYFLKIGGNCFYLDNNPFVEVSSAEKIECNSDMWKNITIKHGHPLYPKDIKELDVTIEKIQEGDFKLEGTNLTLNDTKFEFLQQTNKNFYTFSKK